MLGDKYISRIDQFGMWILLVLVLAFFITGLGMTKHIMNPALASYIHTRLLPVPLLIFFAIHVLKGVRNQFKKWKIFQNDRILDIYSYCLVIGVAIILIWMYFK